VHFLIYYRTYEVAIHDIPRVNGMVLANQMKSLGWQARKVSQAVLDETLSKLKVIIEDMAPQNK